MSFYSDASLVMIPSGYKTSKVYCAKPTDGTGDLAFTRSNATATRVASSGLIEKVRTNVALYSEDQTNWTVANETNVTANAAANPLNGAVTADKVIPTAVSGDHYRGLTMATMNGEITASIFVKADGYNFIDFGIYNSSTSVYPVRATFDLSTQTFTFTNGSIASITAAGSGYFRISITASVAAASSIDLYQRVRPTGGTGNFTGDGTSGMLLWGCQLESGVMTSYIGPTTTAAVSVGPVANVPRLDYLGSSCPRLLLEPQRTNLITFSEQINNADWAKGNSPTITTNIATAPDGTISADGIQSADAATYKTITQTVSVSANGTLTFSFFVKKETSETFFGGFTMYFQGGTNKIVYGIVNAVTGTVTYASSDLTPTTKVEDYGTYWRIASTATDNGSNTSCGIGYYGTLSTNGTVLNTGAGSVRTIWGFQAEVGAYATSYIPTLGASVTRGADAATKTGISSLIGQTEGTIFFEAQRDNSDQDYRVQISDGTTNNWLFVGIETGLNIRAYCNVGGVNQFTTYSVSAVSNATHKIAIAYANNDVKVYVDGIALITITSGSIPATSRLDFGSSSPNNVAVTPSLTSQALLFKTRLSNSELASLTA